MYENGMNNFEHMEQGNLNGNENGGGMNNNPYRPNPRNRVRKGKWPRRWPESQRRPYSLALCPAE